LHSNGKKLSGNLRDYSATRAVGSTSAVRVRRGREQQSADTKPGTEQVLVWDNSNQDQSTWQKAQTDPQKSAYIYRLCCRRACIPGATYFTYRQPTLRAYLDVLLQRCKHRCAPYASANRFISMRWW